MASAGADFAVSASARRSPRPVRACGQGCRAPRVPAPTRAIAPAPAALEKRQRLCAPCGRRSIRSLSTCQSPEVS